jgi:uncharacterized protein YkwD
MESRECPASVNFFHGVLTVTGTNASETIIVSRNGNLVGAEGQWFNAASITHVVISGKGGNDTLRDDSNLTGVIYGGDGNDTISGGRGHDKIYGGRGEDYIHGGRGSDLIYGGGGADTIIGAEGTNRIFHGCPNATRGNTAIELEIIQLVNQYRAANGLPALAVHGRLNVSTAMHTSAMAAIGSIYGPDTGMQHTLYGSTRPEVPDRLAAAGYDNWTYSYAWGENIAYGYTSAEAVMTGWMNSAGHRANILNANFTEIGVSVRMGADGILYYAQNFGTRS